MDILREPRVTLIARPQFLEPAHLQVQWRGESSDGERIAEFAGRLCYMSQHNPAGRTTAEYLRNILSQGHGSVFEHSTYAMLIEGISRSCSHELVRHRAGWGYSQLSQRYVDEATANFVEPEVIARDERMHALWLKAVRAAHQAYLDLVEGLMEAMPNIENKTERRKRVREAARSVLPNATETMIFCSANARALRHFIELRGAEGAEAEIRRVALKLLRLMQQEAPTLFGDYEIVRLENGAEVARTAW